MSKDILSQEEVDALLKGVTGESDAQPEETDKSAVRAYNLGKQERIVRGRMPTLDIINDRFARLLRIGLFNLIRRSPEISVGPMKMVKYSEFIRNLVVPTNLNVVHMKPLRGSCLFIFDPGLVFAVVDNLFGGDGRFHSRVEGRDFTQTELRIIQRMLEVVFENYEKSWAPIQRVKFEYVRSEMHTQFANIATPSEIVVAMSFNVEIGQSGGPIHICMPYSMIEPIRDVLYSSMQGDRGEPDKRWVRMLSRQVQLADVDLIAQFARIPVTLEKILGMKAGDVIGTDIPKTVVAEIDGVPVFECSYGTQNGQYAIKVDRILAVAPKDNQLGD